MEDIESRFSANAAQASFWNTEAGLKWVQHANAMDTRLAALTDELLRRTSVQSGEKVLDVGCGSGATTQILASTVGVSGHIYAVDISEPMLRAANERCAGLTNVSFENADAQVHEFTIPKVDLVFSRFGVMFFSDPYLAFTNLGRTLRPGGRLHFVCWAPLKENPWFTVALSVAKKHLGAPQPSEPRAPGPLAFSDPEYVHDILGKSGFQNIGVERFATTLTGPEPAEEQAELYLKLGPASRLINEREPSAQTIAAIRAELVEELKIIEAEKSSSQDTSQTISQAIPQATPQATPQAISLGASVFYVSATR